MKYVFALIFLTVSLVAPAFSQHYQWVWMNGEPTPGDLDEQSGTPSFHLTKSQPFPRISPLLWVDKDDNLWLFGGYAVSDYSLNDLWRYDTHKNEWMIIKGDYKLGKKSVYGVKGEPSAENMPSGRGECRGWVDTTGNLWLFGGRENEIHYIRPGQRKVNYYHRNDTWMFNVKLNQWAWVGGDTTEPSKVPEEKPTDTKDSTIEMAAELLPSRRCCSTLWTSNNGEIYIFSGYNYYTVLNDFWRYTPATKTYVLLSSAPSGVYGTKGKFSSNNIPGARMESASWTDRDGNLWLYGGSQFGKLYQDMWEYNVKLNQWAWISGDSAAFNPVSIIDESNVLLKKSPVRYGSRGISSPENTPGPRSGAVSFKDQADNFWLFAGFGSATYNDVWKYDRTKDEWTWMKGDSRGYGWDAGNYGVRGIVNEQNRPGSRYKMAGGMDRRGNFWMFGGEARSPNGLGYFNDLWKWSTQDEKQ